MNATFWFYENTLCSQTIEVWSHLISSHLISFLSLSVSVGNVFVWILLTICPRFLFYEVHTNLNWSKISITKPMLGKCPKLNIYLVVWCGYICIKVFEYSLKLEDFGSWKKQIFPKNLNLLNKNLFAHKKWFLFHCKHYNWNSEEHPWNLAIANVLLM